MEKFTIKINKFKKILKKLKISKIMIKKSLKKSNKMMLNINII